MFFLTGDEIILFFGDFRFLLDGGVKLEGESDNSPCTRSTAESFLFSVSLVFLLLSFLMLEYSHELSIYSAALVEHRYLVGLLWIL